MTFSELQAEFERELIGELIEVGSLIEFEEQAGKSKAKMIKPGKVN